MIWMTPLTVGKLLPGPARGARATRSGSARERKHRGRPAPGPARSVHGTRQELPDRQPTHPNLIILIILVIILLAFQAYL